MGSPTAEGTSLAWGRGCPEETVNSSPDNFTVFKGGIRAQTLKRQVRLWCSTKVQQPHRLGWTSMTLVRPADLPG
jgi:predicted phosphoadenosine phosphosulfate sulfurtransferase